MITLLKGLQNSLEASNAILLKKLSFYREVVNNENTADSGFLQGRAEAMAQ